MTDSLTAEDAGFDKLPFSSASRPAAQYLLTGTINRENDKHGIRINLALTDLKSGKVLAQSSALALAAGLDATPTAFYRDTPINLRLDHVIAGYIRTTKTTPGQAADADYLRSLPADMQLSEANGLYDQNRYQEALEHYGSSTHWKLGRAADAEQDFSRLVTLGIADRTLGVKFLFNPGTKDFWSDPNVSGAYEMWLRQIARGIAASGYCVKVVGHTSHTSHTSHTGSELFNDTLSLNRATYIAQRLQLQDTQLHGRLESEGRGYRENIVGIGTDDVRDALDRRVEFTVHDCH